MNCQFCKCKDSKVVDSRPTESSIRRRRECLGCHSRFTTYEIVDIVPMLVVKKDGTQEIFDRNKILKGLLNAAYKRPVTTEQLKALVASVETDLQNSLRTEIPSSDIGRMVMDKLKALDEVAYVRFASVYREFRDVDTFMEELQKLQEKKEP